MRLRLVFCLAILAPALGSPVDAAPAGAATRQQVEIAAAIRRDMAELVAGINAHDPVQATAHEAADVISMESGRPSSIGLAADREGLKMAFTHNPDWKVRLIDETVDVARSGDMAVYRSTYWQDSSKDGVPLTQKINVIAGFKRQPDSSWQIGWYIVSAMEPSHKK